MNADTTPLEGANVVVFDCEVKLLPGTECSWTDYKKMGCSVACAFDFRSMDYVVYMDDNMAELKERLASADLVAGFNIWRFDVKLLEAVFGAGWPDVPTYDIYKASCDSVGINFKGPHKGGLNMNAHMLATFGPADVKSGDGAEAPKLWKTRQLGKLISYVIRDVRCEAKLFRHIWRGLPIKSELHGPRVLASPQAMMRARV